MADTPQPPVGQDPQQQQQQAEVVLKEDDAKTCYANFARVTANPEEVIIDYGLNPAPFQAGKQEVEITQRMILNFYTAKRLCMALAMTLQKHEGMFGQIELDVRRRIQNQGGQAGAGQAGAGQTPPQAAPPGKAPPAGGKK